MTDEVKDPLPVVARQWQYTDWQCDVWCTSQDHPDKGHLAPNPNKIVRELVLKTDAELIQKENEQLKAQVAELKAILANVPVSPEQVVQFMRGSYNSMYPADEMGQAVGPPEDVTYSCTVHDLLSAFDWAGLDEGSISEVISSH